ncbi:MAG: VWA domain-containing protein [Balneolaceae bacterium]|nr:MAG: VWA domain-containing protein [Balneolaceae bacterium]
MIYGIFQGISPVLPALLIILLAAISFSIAWWSYTHLQILKPSVKWGLISLRAAALFILVILLLNPFITRQVSLSESPAVAVYFDNSQSMSVERGEYYGIQTYRQLVEQFDGGKQDNLRYDEFLFDENIIPGSDLTLTGTRTNISDVMEHIRENENRYRAAILFSDGIVTHGRNPVFAAQNLSIPVITVPVGDTTTVRDIAVAGVDYVQTGYTFTRQTIRAEIQQEGFEGEEAVVQFIKEGEVVDSQLLEFTAPSSSQVVEFFVEFDEPGFFDFEINIPAHPDEFTDQNNREIFAIEVLDDKTRILSLAFEVHPDVATIRRLIATDQQNELTASTYLGNNRFAGEDPRNISEPFDLIVLHGLPAVGSPLFDWVESRNAPLLYMALPGSYMQKSDSNAARLIGYRMLSSGNPADVQIDNFLGGISHPLLEVDAVNFQRLPSLKSYRSGYQVSPAAQELAGLLFQRLETEIPLLISIDTSIRRIASVNAFGWFRFEQSQQEETRRFFNQLFTNLVSWASTPPDQRLLTIEPVKQEFTENEEVEIRAMLFNERGEPEPEALINITVYDGNMPEPLNSFRMNHSQNEVYSVSIGNYPQGIYRVEARAVKNDREIGTAESRVNVRQSSIEFLTTKRDDNLLETLAEITAGRFLDDLDFDSLNIFLSEIISDQPDEEFSEDFLYLYRSGFWFFLVVLLLSGEWLLRRSVSLP